MSPRIWQRNLCFRRRRGRNSFCAKEIPFLFPGRFRLWAKISFILSIENDPFFHARGRKKSFRKNKIFFRRTFFLRTKVSQKIYFTRAGKNILHYKWFFLERILKKKNFLPEKWRVNCVSEDLTKKFMFSKRGSKEFFAQKTFPPSHRPRKNSVFLPRGAKFFLSPRKNLFYPVNRKWSTLGRPGIIFFWAPEKKTKITLPPPPGKKSSLQIIFLWAGRILLLPEK